jgi:NAD(P)H-hydrate epimerase
MQEVDARAIGERGIEGLELMEQAGLRCVEEIDDIFGGHRGKALVVIGKGNNGGDGLVIARHLRKGGWKVAVFSAAPPEELAGDAAVNLRRIDRSSILVFTDPDLLPSLLKDADLVVDALLGTGLGSEVRGLCRDVIEAVNASGKPVLAVDLPSGVNGTTGEIMGIAIKADVTVTFAAAKLGHVIYPGASQVGRLVVTDIGIPLDILAEADAIDYVDRHHAATLIRRRSPAAHKGTCGHCLLVAGSPGKTGAAAMAANSAVRGGAGLVTLAVPASLNAIAEVMTYEAMTLPIADDGTGLFSPDVLPQLTAAMGGKTVLAAGPGLTQDTGVQEVVRTLVSSSPLPMVLDADGLNALAEDRAPLLTRNRDIPLVLTPHPGEMARLRGSTVAEVESDRIGTARSFAREFGLWLVLKGARTVVASPDGRVSINGSGNPGMASGGMGDVLTGVIAALLAQGYPPEDACRLGVFAHGLAADMAAGSKGEMGLAARDVQERLPHAFRAILHFKEKQPC